MNAIEVRNLNKYFYNPVELHVLKNISFDIYPGKLTSIVGKSGSGKSTLLYLLSTMDTDFNGSIKIYGDEIKNRDNKWLSNFRNRNMGFIFQFHYLLPEFSVINNVMLPALKLGGKPHEQISDEALTLLRLLHIEKLANKKASSLSGGEQQRVAIARALINKPSLIIGDEPTGNLDSLNTEIIQNLFKELCHTMGQTILTVTHDDDFANNSDEIIHMKDGMITS